MKIFRICPAPFHIEAFRERHRLKEKSVRARRSRFFARKTCCCRAAGRRRWSGRASKSSKRCSTTGRLQGRWASESGHERALAEPNWQFKILLYQVKQFQPDVIFIYAGALFWLPRAHREQLRAVCRRPVIVTGFWGDELLRDDHLRGLLRRYGLRFLQQRALRAAFSGRKYPDLHHRQSVRRYDPLFRAGREDQGLHLLRRDRLRISRIMSAATRSSSS